jgi:hypothetical protein
MATSQISQSFIGSNDTGGGTDGQVVDRNWVISFCNAINALFSSTLDIAALIVEGVSSLVGKVTFSQAPMVPAASGSAIFGLDCTDTAVISIVNNASSTVFGAANNFSGLLILSESIATGNCGVFATGGGFMSLISDTGTSPVFSITIGTAGKINVYVDSITLAVTVQNKFGATINIRVMGIRTRPTQ